MFSKNGLMTSNDKFYTVYTFRGLVLFKKSRNLSNKNSFAILKLRKSQKLAFFTPANPDWSHSFDTFDIALLNSKHTEKDIIISLKNQDNADKASDFLKKHSHLTLEVYSPDFS